MARPVDPKDCLHDFPRIDYTAQYTAEFKGKPCCGICGVRRRKWLPDNFWYTAKNKKSNTCSTCGKVRVHLETGEGPPTQEFPNWACQEWFCSDLEVF